MSGSDSGQGSTAQRGRRRFPRSKRLKRRALIRPLFQAGRSDAASVTSGPLRLVVRVVPSSQLPEGTRVQVGFAARRGARGVDRVRIRRLLRESFRVFGLPQVDSSIGDLIGPDQGLTLMWIDRRRPDRELPRLEALGAAMQQAWRASTSLIRGLSRAPHKTD